MDLLEKEFTINISPLSLLVGAGAVFLLSIGVYLLINSYRKRHKRVRTGFLGKPLYQLSIIFVILSLFIGVYYLSVSEVPIISEAQKEVQTDISYEVLSKENGVLTVQFKAVPKVDGKDWGDPSDTFDIFWNIRPDDSAQLQGQENIDQFETARSSSNKSGFITYLIPGEYKVRVITVYNEQSFESSRDIVLN